MNDNANKYLKVKEPSTGEILVFSDGSIAIARLSQTSTIRVTSNVLGEPVKSVPIDKEINAELKKRKPINQAYDFETGKLFYRPRKQGKIS